MERVSAGAGRGESGGYLLSSLRIMIIRDTDVGSGHSEPARDASARAGAAACYDDDPAGVINSVGDWIVFHRLSPVVITY